MTLPNTAPAEIEAVENSGMNASLLLQGMVETDEAALHPQQTIEAELIAGMLSIDDNVPQPPNEWPSKNSLPRTAKVKLVELPIDYPKKMDTASFAVIYRTYFPVLSNFIQRKIPKACQGMHDGDSLAQEALMKLYKHTIQDGRVLERQNSLQGWLYTTIMRDALIVLRTNKRRPYTAVDPADMNALVEAHQLAHDDSIVNRLRTTDRLEPLFELEERQKSLLWDHYVKGVPITVMAEEYGVAPGTIKSRLSRAKKKIRNLGSMATGSGEEADL
jgi:RNA polymerase sigma factor (sigma-70 family)